MTSSETELDPNQAVAVHSLKLSNTVYRITNDQWQWISSHIRMNDEKASSMNHDAKEGS